MTEILYVMPRFVISLLLTLMLEFAASLIFRVRGRDLLLFLLVNIFTNPVAVYLDMLCRDLYPSVSIFVWQVPIELCVVAAEGLIYFKLSKNIRLPWVFAVVANVFSYGVGLVLNYTI